MNKIRIKSLGQQVGSRLRSTSGETLVETLTTVIMLGLAGVLLTGAIVTAARVSYKANNEETAFTTENQIETDGTITIKENGRLTATTLPVTVYTTENGYIYYQPQE